MKKIFLFLVAGLILFANNVDAARYDVRVKRVGNNMYKDLNSGTLIKTSLCLELALGDEAILIWDCALGSEIYGCGKLIFINSGTSCQVDAVYQ
jgi:flagellar basal body rod protein FlgF